MNLDGIIPNTDKLLEKYGSVAIRPVVFAMLKDNPKITKQSPAMMRLIGEALRDVLYDMAKSKEK